MERDGETNELEEINSSTNLNNSSMNKTNTSLNLSNMIETINRQLYSFKLILLGDVSVGKTSILNRYINNTFVENCQCSVGVEFKVTSLILDSTTQVSLKIWDTSGQEKFRALTRNYYNDSQGVVLVYDVTSKSTFQNLKRWLNDLEEFGSPESQIIIVANKADVSETKRQVSKAEGEAFAEKQKLLFIEVSAKEGTNILILFEKITKKLVEQHKEKEKMKSTKGTFLHKNQHSIDSAGFAKKNKDTINCC